MVEAVEFIERTSLLLQASFSREPLYPIGFSNRLGESASIRSHPHSRESEVLRVCDSGSQREHAECDQNDDQ
jgi:hypothetical protein